MKKKEYSKPQIVVYQIESTQLLAGSPGDGLREDIPVNPNPTDYID